MPEGRRSEADSQSSPLLWHPYFSWIPPWPSPLSSGDPAQQGRPGWRAGSCGTAEGPAAASGTGEERAKSARCPSTALRAAPSALCFEGYLNNHRVPHRSYRMRPTRTPEPACTCFRVSAPGGSRPAAMTRLRPCPATGSPSPPRAGGATAAISRLSAAVRAVRAWINCRRRRCNYKEWYLSLLE